MASVGIAALVIRQLFSGALLNPKSVPWMSRNHRPAVYWSVVAVETAWCLTVIVAVLLE